MFVYLDTNYKSGGYDISWGTFKTIILVLDFSKIVVKQKKGTKIKKILNLFGKSSITQQLLIGFNW